MRPPSLICRPLAKIPKRPTSAIADGAGGANCGRMIAIHIFEENHRFSKKTPQPGPRSVVGAATGRRAASSRGSKDVLTEPTSAVCKPFILP